MRTSSESRCDELLCREDDGGEGDPKGAGVLTTRTRYSREMYRHIDIFSDPGVLTTRKSDIDHPKIAILMYVPGLNF